MTADPVAAAELFGHSMVEAEPIGRSPRGECRGCGRSSIALGGTVYGPAARVHCTPTSKETPDE